MMNWKEICLDDNCESILPGKGSHPCQNVTKLWTLSVPPLGTPVLPNLDEFTEKLKRPLTTVFFGMGNT